MHVHLHGLQPLKFISTPVVKKLREYSTKVGNNPLLPNPKGSETDTVEKQ